MRRRIKSAQVKFISLVPRGANRLPVLYKSDEQQVELQALTKLNDDGELLAVVYAPELRDSQGDIASAEVIKQMAYDASRDGVDIDIRHDGKPVGKERAFIAEKFIVAKGDERFRDWKDYDGKPVDLTGSWAVVAKIADPALRQLYREGKWNGVSLFGPAQVEIEKSEVPMLTLEELKKALAENNTAIEAKFDAKLAALKLPKPDDIKKSDDFDPLDPKQVERKLAELDRQELLKSVDWSDVESVRAYREALAARNGAPETLEQKSQRLEKECAALKDKLAKSRKASNLPNTRVEKGDDTIDSTLSKEEQEAVAHGRAMAEIANSNRGYSKK